MRKKKSNENRIRRAVSQAAALILSALLVPGLASGLFTYDASAADITKAPLREVHRVKVGNKRMCFFVQDNVVLTPEVIAEMSDLELTNEIIDSAGLYMRQTNCTKENHLPVTSDRWISDGGSFKIDEEDIEKLREAEPSDGSPVLFYLDPGISTEPAPEEVKKNSKESKAETEEKKSDSGSGTESGTGSESGSGTGTESGTGSESGSESGTESGTGSESGSGTDNGTGSGGTNKESEEESDISAEEIKDDRVIYHIRKLLSPHILFVAVATESDAEKGEYICKAEESKQKSRKEKAVKEPKEKQDMLPEFRTISMTDRSGPPLEPTLQEGTPVTLEWIDPDQKSAGEAGSSLIEKIPGGFAGLIVIGGAAAAAAAVFAKKRKKHIDE